MQYQTCECGEKISPTELATKLLTHMSHQPSCVFSYIGCVSKVTLEYVLSKLEG